MIPVLSPIVRGSLFWFAVALLTIGFTGVLVIAGLSLNRLTRRWKGQSARRAATKSIASAGRGFQQRMRRRSSHDRQSDVIVAKKFGDLTAGPRAEAADVFARPAPGLPGSNHKFGRAKDRFNRAKK